MISPPFCLFAEGMLEGVDNEFGDYQTDAFCIAPGGIKAQLEFSMSTDLSPANSAKNG